jgi:hypothetical protein
MEAVLRGRRRQGMPFIEVKGKKADSDAVSITFERTVLEDLDRYTKFTNRDSRSETVNDILRKVFATDEEFVANKPAGHTGRKKGKANGSGPMSGDGVGDGSGEGSQPGSADGQAKRVEGRSSDE